MAPKDSTLPIDPNVKVPDAVKRAAARAEAHYQPATPAPVQVQPAAPVAAPQASPQVYYDESGDPIETGPQSRNQTHTHVWDEKQGKIVPV